MADYESETIIVNLKVAFERNHLRVGKTLAPLELTLYQITRSRKMLISLIKSIFAFILFLSIGNSSQSININLLLDYMYIL